MTTADYYRDFGRDLLETWEQDPPDLTTTRPRLTNKTTCTSGGAMTTTTDSEWLVAELGQYADRLTSWLETTPPASNEESVGLLVAIRDLRADLAFLASELEHALLANKPPKRFSVNGAEVEIKHATARTKWANDDLMKVVVARALDERKSDPETGEMLEPGWQTVARVVNECMRPSWRLTPLRARGIDPDEFCEVDEGHLSVVLPPRN